MNFCEQAFNKIINHIRETTHPPPPQKKNYNCNGELCKK